MEDRSVHQTELLNCCARMQRRYLDINLGIRPSETTMSKERQIPIRRHSSAVLRELTLQQMLDDDIVQDIMRSDRVCPRDIETMFGVLRRASIRVAA